MGLDRATTHEFMECRLQLEPPHLADDGSNSNSADFKFKSKLHDNITTIPLHVEAPQFDFIAKFFDPTNS